MQQPLMRTFLLLLGCSVFLFSTTLGVTAVFGGLNWNHETYETGTEIAGVSVAGMKPKQAREELYHQIEDWYEKADLSLHLFEESIQIPSDVILFDVDQALAEATTDRHVSIKTEVHQQRLRDATQSFSRYDALNWTDYSSLMTSLSDEIESFDDRRLSIDVSEHLVSDYEVEPSTVASIEIQVSSSTYLAQWTEALDGYEVQGRTIFSLQEALREARQPLLDSEGLDVLATGLFQLFGQTNIQIVERHIGLQLPSYTTVGYAASASQQSMDFKVYNPNYYPYKLSATYQAGNLSLSLYGKTFIHDYQLHVEEIKEIDPRTVVHFSSNRRIGDKQVMQQGSLGYSAHVYHIERSTTGEVIVKKKLGIDYYPPQHKIEEWSLQERPAAEEEVTNNSAVPGADIPFPSDPNSNSSIDSGTQEEPTGQNGPSEQNSSTDDKEGNGQGDGGNSDNQNPTLGSGQGVTPPSHHSSNDPDSPSVNDPIIVKPPIKGEE